MPPAVLVVTARDATRELALDVVRELGHDGVVVDHADAVTADLLPISAVIVDLLGVASPGAVVERLRAVLGDAPQLVALPDLFHGDDDDAADGWTREFAVFLPRPLEGADLAAALRALLPPPPPPGPPLPRVLLADDDAIGLRLATRVLELQGFRVIPATNGIEALRIAIEEQPDAVVSDIVMPECDGLTLCTRLRTNAATATIPVILVSAHDFEEADRVLAAKAGATAWFVRSPRLVDVIAALQEAIDAPPAPVEIPHHEAVAAVEAELGGRFTRQLTVLAALNMQLARRTSLTAAELSVFTQLADGLAEAGDVRVVLSRALSTIVEVVDLAFALVYLADEFGDPKLYAASGDVFIAGRDLPADEALRPLLTHADQATKTIAVPEDVTREVADALLRGPRAASLLVAPVKLHGVLDGALVIGADRQDLSTPEHRRFARLVGAHVGQGIGLHRLARRATARPGRRAARIAADLASLGTVLACLPGGDPHLAGLAAALRRPEPAPLDLADLVGARLPGDGEPATVLACRRALTAALDALGALGAATPPTVLRGASGLTLRFLPAGAAPAHVRAIAVDILRRHGGDAHDRDGVGGVPRVVIRLPFADRAADPLGSTID